MKKEVKVLSIEGPNGLSFSACTLPAPMMILGSVFPDVAGLPSPLELCSTMELVPVPSVVMDADGLTQITTSEECMAIAKYFRRCAKWLEQIETTMLGDEEFDPEEFDH